MKDPAYPDTMYVDGLIGPDTIDTLPEKTLEAFIDHGVVRNTLESDSNSARQALDELAALGIDLDRVTAELEPEGIEAFAKSYEQLLATLRRAAAPQPRPIKP